MKKTKKTKQKATLEICGKPWRGMAGGSGDKLPLCKQRQGHNGLCGPKAGWVWADDRDAALELLGPQHPPWERRE